MGGWGFWFCEKGRLFMFGGDWRILTLGEKEYTPSGVYTIVGLNKKNKMATRRTSNINHQQIIDYWSIRVYEGDLSIDFSEADERCWRCGYKSSLEKCHIVPHSLGGKDEPSNYVLLCKLCHEENPNVDDPNIMWDWLKAHKVDFYDTYWVLRGLKEYEFIYGKSLDNPGTNTSFT
ncbi:MAG: HNH endonuclease signature motif containing protein [bacterium]|nr:HNH endonuclease signature motif containing protein [bacterium]